MRSRRKYCENYQNIENIDNYQNIDNIDNNKNVENIDNNQNIENIDHYQNIENIVKITSLNSVWFRPCTETHHLKTLSLGIGVIGILWQVLSKKIRLALLDMISWELDK